MPEDHLSNETSLSAELTEHGVKASARSRTVAAVDRLFGNMADLGNAWMEGVSARKRAKTAGELQLIEAAARYGIERMGQDRDFAERAFGNHFRKVASQQLNKDAVVTEALIDLRSQPPSEVEASGGPTEVSEDFMNRFETFAEGATSEELRQRWGRILASEIRRPGTFSPKVLRATDELEASVASMFEGLMRYRVRNVLVRCIMPPLEFADVVSLVSAGLIIDPGFGGHRLTYGEGHDDTGAAFWGAAFGVYTVGFSKDFEVPTSYSEILQRGEPNPTYSVYMLTDIGIALSSILTCHEEQVGIDYLKQLLTVVPREHVCLWQETAPNTGERLPLPV